MQAQLQEPKYPAAGDTVTCYVDTDAGSVSYAVNGAWLGEAFTIPKDQPIFPHALAKNAAVTASFDTVPKVDTGLDTSSFHSWQVYMGHCLAWQVYVRHCIGMGWLSCNDASVGCVLAHIYPRLGGLACQLRPAVLSIYA